MQITREDDPSMMIDTDKFIAIRDAVGAPPGADAAVVASFAANMRTWRDNLMRSRFGLLALLFVDAEDIDAGIDWLMKKGQKKKK